MIIERVEHSTVDIHSVGIMNACDDKKHWVGFSRIKLYHLPPVEYIKLSLISKCRVGIVGISGEYAKISEKKQR